jgi:REP-associated tyrosine transposase
MPRTARASVGGICYHVLNRGNGRRQVFRKEGDYAAFERAMAHACIEVPMRVLGWCLMPNHFHLVVWPESDGDLSRWMHWLLNTHVRRYHRHYHDSGHIWQGRFKAFPIEQDAHLLTVLRYGERNPVRAQLVRSAEEWLWSSARCWQDGNERPPYLLAGPVRRPKNWLEWVNEPLSAGELEALRRSVNRSTPFGSASWTVNTAEQLGLESTLRPRGRPRKDPDEKEAKGTK